MDIVGGYECHCTTGYTGNGTHCSGQEEIYETKLMCVPCFDWDSSFLGISLSTYGVNTFPLDYNP